MSGVTYLSIYIIYTAGPHQYIYIYIYIYIYNILQGAHVGGEVADVEAAGLLLLLQHLLLQVRLRGEERVVCVCVCASGH